MILSSERDPHDLSITYTLKIDHKNLVKAGMENNDNVLFTYLEDSNTPIYLKLYSLAVLTKRIEERGQNERA